MKKYRYQIINLDCPNCARKLKEYLKKQDELANVVVNFNTKKLSFESENTVSLNKINSLVKQIEPEVSIIDNMDSTNKEYPIIDLIVAIILVLVSLIVPFKILKDVLIIISYIILLKRPVINSIKTLIRSRSINENLLITISCIGAYLIGEVYEGLMVVLLYTIGKILEEKAVNKTRNSIHDLMDLKQDYANKKFDNEIRQIKVDEIKLEDVLVIKKGEKVPVDGIITKGKALCDTSMLTGESELVTLNIEDEVLSGYINNGEVFEMKVRHTFNDSTVSRILE